MKKLLAIIVLGLLMSVNLHAKVIILKECAHRNVPFNPKDYIKNDFKIDTNKSILQRVRIMTDSYYEDQKKEMMKNFGNTTGLEKIDISEWNIKYFDNRFIKAKRGSGRFESTWEIDLKNKTGVFKSNMTSGEGLWKCK